MPFLASFGPIIPKKLKTSNSHISSVTYFGKLLDVYWPGSRPAGTQCVAQVMVTAGLGLAEH